MSSYRRLQLSHRAFVRETDARILMGADEAALCRLWKEKRGEAEPEDVSLDLIAELDSVTEELNRTWYERNSGRHVRDVRRHVQHGLIPWMAATLDGVVDGIEAVFESTFMLPWSFSENAAAEKFMPDLQHKMWVTNLRSSVLSIITGGGEWVEITVPVDPLYLSLLVAAEKKFWRCVQSGVKPHLINLDAPRPRIEAVRIVDMSSSEAWAEFAGLFRGSRQAFLDHERSKQGLEALVPKGVSQAIGHGVRGCRLESGEVTFDLLDRHVVTQDPTAGRGVSLAPVE